LPSLPVDPLVSVVIPALNEERYITACLGSLIAQDYPPSQVEVLVADGGSADRTRALIAEVADTAPFPIRIVENPERRTAQGLNAGVRASRGNVVIILGAHALASPSFVSASVHALRETGAAAVGGPIETRGEGDVANAIAAALSHPFGVGDARFRFATEPAFVDTIAFAAYRRECFDLLSGFDTDRDKAEDDFFNYRIRQAGGRLYLTPAVSSVYFARSSFPSVARQYFGYGKAKGRAAIEEPRSIQPRHLAPLVVVACGMTLTLLRLFSGAARLVTLTLAALYVAAAGFSALRSTSRRGNPGLAPITAVVFPVVHLAYGLGTALGAFQAFRRRS
jgi:succinoglycan biosynthesis protein ExoA